MDRTVPDRQKTHFRLCLTVNRAPGCRVRNFRLSPLLPECLFSNSDLFRQRRIASPLLMNAQPGECQPGVHSGNSLVLR